ncbi:uncharacterized protein LOC112046351 [Bicyclus anynana]|uniref:Uncharacterized protein LOC112046351 n=1 Tax=Bicyclus anynana TaxID=110368 RepID=A0ABM3M5E4_BICAN|nr:uncharacterized protein LOC112046351 [Bicyclus anynana]
MDWLKLFTLLVAVVFTSVLADGSKKKIRIHLPQKVKHIHHHKKIYITNHPASSQYAPAYVSSGEGTVAVPSNILPAVANIVPIYDETPTRLHSNSPAASQLLPLYHARGYYGPTPNEIEESDYDSAGEPVEYGPAVYSSAAHSSRPPRRLKIVKLNEPPQKKVVRKGKPKRVVVRNKPQSHSSIEGELPVTTFHEQFYSDVDGSGTVRKVKKPPRIEKIVDGDTEHIHTYSEEHIHKLFYDQGAKVAGVVGVDPITGMSAISPQHIIPFKGRPTLVALPSHPFAGIAAVGAVANPNNYEYAAYNARDVTHDHIFHDHGEIPIDIDLNKEALAIPPKVSYNSQGLRISGTQKKYKSKNSQKGKKVTKQPTSDFSYYESIYTPNRPRKIPRPTVPTYDTTGDAVDDYQPVPNFGYKEIHKKPRTSSYYGKQNDYRSEEASVPTPFEISNTVLHEYKPKRYSGSGSSPEILTKLRDPFANFKDTYTNNFEYDTYASSSNNYRSEDKNDSGFEHRAKNGKKKSISTQNISFGGQDQITWNVDHTADAANIDDDSVPTALDMDQFDEDQNDNTPKDSSQVEQFFSMLAGRDLNAGQITMPDASNNNYQYVEPPTVQTQVHATATTTPNLNMDSTETILTESPKTIDTRKSRRNKETEPKNNERHTRDNRSKPPQNPSSSRSHEQDTNSVGKLKYGDKI